MVYKPTRLIAESFEEDGIDYFVEEIFVKEKNLSLVHTAITISEGPTLTCRFLSHNDNSDVAVKVQGLFNDIHPAKHEKIKEVCNEINNRCRFGKFLLDKKGNVNVVYDMPPFLPDNTVGEAAFIIRFIMEQVISENYLSLAKVVYSDHANGDTAISNSLYRLFENLSTLHEKPIILDESENVNPKRELDEFYEDLIYKQECECDFDEDEDEEELMNLPF